MADLTGAIGSSLLGSKNSSGLAAPIFGAPSSFSYPQNNAPGGPVGTIDQGGVLGDSTAQSTAQQQAAATAAANAAKMASFNEQHQGITSSADAQSTAAANTYKSGILDYITQLQQGQNAINSEGTQSELSKRQGNQSILDQVGHGLQSGGAMLASKNASSSSAVDALSRAYSTLGQHALAGVGTQYAQDQAKIGTEQTNLDLGTQQQARHNDENKTAVTNGIVADAENRLRFLDAAIAGASLPDRINIEQEKQAIKDKAMAALSQYDSSFAQGVGGIHASDSLTRQAGAADLANAGVTAAKSYQLGGLPSGVSDTSPAAGSALPIYVAPRKQLA